MDSSERTWVSERRRSILQLLGVATGGGVLAESTGVLGADGPSSYRLVQDGRCLPLEPFSGDQPVEKLYSYQLPAGEWDGDNGARDDGGPYYSSRGTRPIQRHDTSLLFLYDGPKGLSLVVVHGKTGTSPRGGGSATFEVAGLPADGSWVVKDDYYLDPETGEPASTNYDRWRVGGSPHRIDWTWGSRTDGGAFRDLGRDFEVTIDPAFNDASGLSGQHYEGEVAEWQVLSGDPSDPDRQTLDMAKPVTITTGACDGAAGGEGSGAGKPDGKAAETETDADRQRTKHERKEERRERKHERKQQKHERKAERRERKHERKQRKHERKEEERDDREEREQEREARKHERKEQKHERKEQKHERKEQKHERKEEEEEGED